MKTGWHSLKHGNPEGIHGKHMVEACENVLVTSGHTNYFKNLEDGINSEHSMEKFQKRKNVRFVCQNGEIYISHTHQIKKIEIFTTKLRTGETRSEIMKTKKFIALTHIIENFL